jgi:hypothetical protein
MGLGVPGPIGQRVVHVENRQVGAMPRDDLAAKQPARTGLPAPTLTWTEVWSELSDFRPQSHRTNPGRCSSERPPKKGDLVIMPVIKIIRSSQKLQHGVDQGNGARVVKRSAMSTRSGRKLITQLQQLERLARMDCVRAQDGRFHVPSTAPHFAALYSLSGQTAARPPGPGHCESLSPMSIDDMSLPLLGIRRPHSVQVRAVS